MIFESGLWAGHSMVFVLFSSMDALLGEPYEQEHCHSENNNYHLGNDCPQTTVQISKYFVAFIVPSTLFSQTTDVIVWNANPNHDTDFSVYTNSQVGMFHRFFCTYRLDCHFQSQSGSRPRQSPFSNHQKATVVFSFHHVTRFFLFTSRIRIFVLHSHQRYPLLRINLHIGFFYTHLYFQNC